MDCKEFSNLLDACLEDALSPEDEKRLEEHAAGCADCAARLRLMRDLRALDADAQVPADFSASWRRKLKEETEEEKARGAHPWRSWLTAAAALVFVVGGTVMTRQRLPLTGKGINPRPTAAQVTEASADAYMAPAQAAAPSAEEEYSVDESMSMAADLPVLERRDMLFSMEEAAAKETEDSAAESLPDLGPMMAMGASASNVTYADLDEAADADEAYDMYEAPEEAEEGAAPWDDAQDADGAAPESGSGIQPDQPQEPGTDSEQEGGSFWREAGLAVLCALPWLAIAAFVLLTVRRIRNRKRNTERKD